MEVVELDGGDGAANPGGDGFTGVAHEVRDGEETRGVGGTDRRFNVKEPGGRS